MGWIRVDQEDQSRADIRPEQEERIIFIRAGRSAVERKKQYIIIRVKRSKNIRGNK